MTPQEELELLELTAPRSEPETPYGIFDRILTGMGDIVYGGAQFLENSAEELAPGLAEGIQSLDESLYDITNGVFGSAPGVTMDDRVKLREEEYQRSTGIMPGEFDGARLTGQIIPSLIAPYTRGLPGLVAEGAVYNTAMPTVVEDGETYFGEKAEDATVGAIGGVAGKGIQEVGAHVVNQYARPAIQRMRQAGVQPTVGQSIGGSANTLEEAASSIPLVGPLFSGPRGRAQEEWQLSVLNGVVEPIGGRVTATGTEGITQATKLINDTYEAAFEAMPTMSITPKVSSALKEAEGRAIDMGMNSGAERQFNNIINRVVYSRLPKEVDELVGPSQVRTVNEVTSENVKKIDSELTTIINKDGTDQQLKAALREVRDAFRQQAGDQSKEYQDLIQNADYSYAMFKRAVNAQKADVNSEGFTPAQMVRATMKDASDNMAARGDGLMQADAQAAQTVLGNKLNNSGTSERLAAMALGTGGGALINPAAALAAPLLAAGGSRQGQNFSNRLIENLLAPALERYTPGSTYGLLYNEGTD
jgi:hypothetical protein